jgi:hypothetical protein
MNNQPIQKRALNELPAEEWLTVVRQKVSTLRFGVVQVVVHEGRVVQIECTEKVRLDRPERDQD